MRSSAKAPPSRSTKAKFTDLRMRFGIAAALLAVIAIALPALASADPLTGTPTFFKEGLRPTPFIFNDVTGPEGNVWFVDGREIAGKSAIGKITPSGAITEYVEGTNLSGLNAGAKLTGIAVGPEGKLWVTDRGAEPGIAVIDPASPETATEYSEGLNGGSVPQGIATGPEGSLWFADRSFSTPAIGWINPSNPAELEECPIGIAGSRPRGIVTGADGNLWFTDTGKRAIGKFDPSTCELIEEFATGENTLPGGSTADQGPSGIVAGADGNVWYTGAGEEGSPAIGRITPSGTITKFGTGLTGTSAPLGLTTAPGGKLWFTDESGREEFQNINFEEGAPWVTGNQFELCGKEPGKEAINCEAVSYSEERGTLQGNVQAAVEAILGVETFTTACTSEEEEELEEEAPPTRCRVKFSAFTAFDQVTCTKLTGAGTCEGETFVQGASDAIGSLTYSGEITRYPINGLESVAQVAYSGGNVWFPTGTIANTKIAKFGIETGPTNRRTLTLTKSAGGSGGMGSVKSKPAGINCGTACNEALASMFKSTAVTLTAKPSSTSTFVKWENAVEGGPCDESGSTTCTVPMSEDEAVTAVFGGTSKAIFNPQPLSLSKGESTGYGTVKASGLVCEAACTSTTVLYQGPNVEKAKPGKTVVLTQAAAPGSEFVEWTGACTGSGACSVEMSEAKEVTAVFEALPAQTLTLTKSAGGSGGMGSIKSKPAGINCGTACNSAEATLWEGAVVTLTAKPSATSTFVEWENAVEGSDCDGSTSTTCTVSLNVAEEITAVFGGTSKAIFNPQPLSLSKSGSGLGTVKASGLVCEAACASTTVLYQGPNEEKAKPGKTVVLTQAAAPGSEFVEWTGACTGSGACSVEMSEAKNVTAVFDELE